MPSLWMLFASFAFAAMGAGVKLASEFYTTSELLFYRGLIGAVILFMIVRHRGGTFRTPFPKAHLWRSAVGVTSLWLWFFAISKLPLATAMTLNYMAPIWIAAMSLRIVCCACAGCTRRFSWAPRPCGARLHQWCRRRNF